MKNRTAIYDINRSRPRHGHKYIKYKMSLRIIMVTCIKQHLSSIWNSIHEKVKQHWEHIHMRGEINSSRYDISLRLKISLPGSGCSLLVFTWNKAKWNSNWHEILCKQNLPERNE